MCSGCPAQNRDPCIQWLVLQCLAYPRTQQLQFQVMSCHFKAPSISGANARQSPVMIEDIPVSCQEDFVCQRVCDDEDQEQQIQGGRSFALCHKILLGCRPRETGHLWSELASTYLGSCKQDHTDAGTHITARLSVHRFSRSSCAQNMLVLDIEFSNFVLCVACRYPKP